MKKNLVIMRRLFEYDDRKLQIIYYLKFIVVLVLLEFDCKFCNFRFASQDRAQKHLETHTEEDKSKCKDINLISVEIIRKKNLIIFLQNFTMNGNISVSFVRNDSENNNLSTVTC